MSQHRVRVSVEIGKLRGNIKHLWDLSKETALNRHDCKNLVLEIRKSLKIVFQLARDLVVDRIEKLDSDKRLILTLITGKDPGVFIKEAFKYTGYESDVSSVISRLDSPEYYKDKEVRESINGLVEKLEAELSVFEVKLDMRYGLPKISEFIAMFPQFTDNWAVAACYLTAMEIMVNRKLEELGLERGTGFRDNFNKLLQKFKEQNIEVSEMEKRLPSVFWDIRHKVIHLGYSPAYNEVETITKYVEKVLGTLTRLK